MLKLLVTEDELTRKAVITKANFRMVSPSELEKKSIAKATTTLASGKTGSRTALAKKCSLMDCTTKDRG